MVNDVEYAYIMWTGDPKETAARNMTSEKDGDIRRVNTKEWARSIEYNPVKLFNKVTDKLIGLEGHSTVGGM